MIPTRWRARLEAQLDDATERVARARDLVAGDDGAGGLQAAYQAVVAAATLRVWLETPAWERTLDPDTMHQRTQAAFPNLFAALAALDLQHALTSPWTADAATPYVHEAVHFVDETRDHLARCLSAS